MNATHTSSDKDPQKVDTRVLNAGATDDLKRFQDPQLKATGHLALISLDALAEAYGSRWSLQSGRVQKYLHQLLARELGDESLFTGLSPLDTLVAIPAQECSSARVACVRFLRQVMHHFLGSSSRALEGVYDVVAVSRDRVEAQRIDRTVLAALEGAADLARDRADALARASEPIVPSDGRKVRVSCDLQPLVLLQTRAAVGLRMAPRVVQQTDEALLVASDLAAFAGVDRQRVDWAAASQGVAQLRDRVEKAPTVVVPMTYATLSSQRARSDMLDILKEVREYAAHGVICEISGIEGAPQAQLQEAVAIIRPVSLFIIGKIEAPAQVVWSHLKASGLRGVAFDCPSNDGGAEFLGWASALVKRARRAARSVLLYGLPTIEHAQALHEAGATHATLAD